MSTTNRRTPYDEEEQAEKAEVAEEVKANQEQLREEINALIPVDEYVDPKEIDKLIDKTLERVTEGTLTMSQASRAVGMRFSTLFHRQKKKDLQVYGDTAQSDLSTLGEMQSAIAMASSERVFERIEGDLMSDRDLIKVMNDANRNTVDLKRGPQGGGESGTSMLLTMMQDSGITLTKSDEKKAKPQELDVEGERVD